MKTLQRHFPRALALTILIGLIGCASASPPPPGLRDDQYFNEAYQYSVAIPPGWIAHEKAPEAMASLMGAELTDTMDLILVNPAGGSLIGIIGRVDETDFKTYVHAPVSIWEKMPRALASRMAQKGEVIRFDYELQPDYLAQTLDNQEASPQGFKPEALLTAAFDMRYTHGDSKSKIKWYLYPCQGQNTCQTIFTLACNQDQCEANRSAFDAVASSLTIHTAADN